MIERDRVATTGKDRIVQVARRQACRPGKTNRSGRGRQAPRPENTRFFHLEEKLLLDSYELSTK